MIGVLAVYDARTAAEVDMKPYTFSKCQGFKKNWKKEEFDFFWCYYDR